MLHSFQFSINWRKEDQFLLFFALAPPSLPFPSKFKHNWILTSDHRRLKIYQICLQIKSTVQIWPILVVI